MIRISQFKNKKYAYLYNTEFKVQVCKTRGGDYYTTFNCSGDMDAALRAYNLIDLQLKHTKRIVMEGDLGQTVVDVEKC